MGFRKDSYAKVWEVTPVSDTNTKCRISISRKNKQTDEYEQEFSGYVAFVGTATAKRASQLKEGDRIKLGDVDVTTFYQAEKKITYTNYKCFSFEMADGSNSSPAPKADKTEPEVEVDSGEIDDSKVLPF